MDNTLDKLIDLFTALNRYPRASGHEAAVSQYLQDWGKRQSFAAVRDAANNVIVDVPAAEGCEDHSTVVLQAHMDMVAVARPSYAFDPAKDAVRFYNDGERLYSPDTSIGADDGIGVAMAQLLVMEDIPHGTLRLIFTTDEESGETGALGLDHKWYTGENIRYLLNLDSGQGDRFRIGCAGSRHYTLTLPLNWEQPTHTSAVTIALSGLTGGHSGLDIHLGRVNAILALFTLLRVLQKAGVPFALAAMEGGQAANAIPADGRMVLTLSPTDHEVLRRLAAELQEELRRANAPQNEGALFTITSTPMPSAVLTEDGLRALCGFAQALPNGIHTRNAALGTVQSSSSLGTFRLDPAQATLCILQRSDREALLTAMSNTLTALAQEYGFTAHQTDAAPPWPADPANPLIPLLCSAYRDLTGSAMTPEASHSGLEPAIFATRNPKLKMLSMGPRIHLNHAPGENVELRSVLDNYMALRRVVALLD